MFREIIFEFLFLILNIFCIRLFKIFFLMKTYQKTLFVTFTIAYIIFSSIIFLKTNGYISENITPSNKFVQMFFYVITCYMDLNDEIKFSFWLLGLFIIPNFLSYVWVGLFGFSENIKISVFFRYFLLLLSKSIISFCGIGLGVVLFGILDGLTKSKGILYNIELFLIISNNLNISVFLLYASDIDFLDMLNRSSKFARINKFFQRNNLDESRKVQQNNP